jgi:hypothetical protein
MKQALSAFGQPQHPEAALCRFIGPPLVESFRGLLTGGGVAASDHGDQLFGQHRLEWIADYRERLVVTALPEAPQTCSLKLPTSGVRNGTSSVTERGALVMLRLPSTAATTRTPLHDGTGGRHEPRQRCDSRTGRSQRSPATWAVTARPSVPTWPRAPARGAPHGRAGPVRRHRRLRGPAADRRSARAGHRSVR